MRPDYFIQNAVRLRNRRRRLRVFRHLRIRLRTCVLLLTLCCVTLSFAHYQPGTVSQLSDVFASWTYLPAALVLPFVGLAVSIPTAALLGIITFRLRLFWGGGTMGLLTVACFLIFLLCSRFDTPEIGPTAIRHMTVGHVAFAIMLPSIVLLPIGSMIGWIAVCREHVA